MYCVRLPQVGKIKRECAIFRNHNVHHTRSHRRMQHSFANVETYQFLKEYNQEYKGTIIIKKLLCKIEIEKSYKSLSLRSFLDESQTHPIVDVRSPSEFKQG
jgi:hypothetical protein